jgi:hypothetical protein
MQLTLSEGVLRFDGNDSSSTTLHHVKDSRGNSQVVKGLCVHPVNDGKSMNAMGCICPIKERRKIDGGKF